MNSRQRKTTLFLVLAAIVLTLALGVTLGRGLMGTQGIDTASALRETAAELDAADAQDSGPIELVDLNNRDLDGSPALALTFTQPLDARKSYDEFIQVFE
ncbi:MAG: hypothetical protein LBP52_09085, partial [Burkholderiaceae bacterium]|nr:hypothetical protein [Burkholderiaceae bacterium]